MSIKQLNKKSIDLLNSTQAISSVSSAIKELVENSLDAQAQNIQVNLIDSGLSSIEVKDNGTGISKENAPYMAWPSYTSKIIDFSDLDSLKTYGFRGQALNAACQLSDVTVCTKIEDDETMMQYLLNNKGKIVTSDLTHGSTGTIVRMKNLFKNFPVRRSNMKKRLNQEIKDAEMLLKTYSICQPTIGFRLNVDGKTIFIKNTCKDVFQAFRAVIGMQTFSKLTGIKKFIDKAELMLFVPKKENIDCTGISHNGYQFICINNRPIKSKEIKKLINIRISEYFGQYTCSSSKFIFCVILAVDPSMVDVNLEPNKDKVLLQNMAVILKEIDNLLYNVYGSQSSSVSKEDEIANKVFDMNLDESEKEKGGPPSKKRRLNIQNKNVSSAYANTRNRKTNTDKTIRKTNDHFLKVTDDSNMSNDNVAKSKKKNQGDNGIELMEFQEDEVPEVDLGPDFDLQEILNKSKSLLVTHMKEPHPDGSASSLSHHIDDITWSKGQAPWLQGGVVVSNHDVLNYKKRVEVDFNGKGTVVRRNLDIPEMDACMRDYEETEEWKEIPPVETNQPIQNVSNISCAQTSRKPKSLNFTSLLAKKTKTEAFETEAEKNKTKKFEVTNEIIKKRKFVCWSINSRLVSQSCRKPAEKHEKSIVGSLSSSAWILNWNEQLLVFKTTELHAQLDIRKYNINKIDKEYVQYYVDRWFNEKNDMSIFYSLYSMKK